MAKIHEEIIVIKLSKLVKNDQNSGTLVGEETVAALEAVVQELVGADIIVEVESAQ
jgi:hypothetical protein